MIGRGLDGREAVYAITTMHGTMENVSVVMGLPTEIAFAEANHTLFIDMAILVLVLAAVSGLAWYLGDVLIVKQAQSLVRATRQLADGDYAVQTGMDYSSGELGAVARSFDAMAQEIALREAERDRHEATLTEYARNLEHSNQELRDFANIAAHDLQEPLRKIQTFGEMLQERCKPGLDEQGNDYVRRMQEGAGRMQALITALRSYSNVNTKNIPSRQIDLNEIVKQVLKDLDWSIEQERAVIHLSELPTIEADPLLMTQLFQNLISNALKFHHPDRPPVIEISAQRHNGKKKSAVEWEILVKDEGIGFDEKYAERIFQPFQRLHNQSQYEGTGMGLAICRKIVDRHGGSIQVRSAPEKGTTFILLLPAKQRSERVEPA
jgi:light-regulated signal transduction histidine kinase (bacteriophytochrome)